MASIIPKRVLSPRRKIFALRVGCFFAMRMNALTSGLLGLWRVKVPWVAADEDQAIQLALRMCGRPDTLDARVARIRNTLSLSAMAISEALVPEALAAGARLA